ncbi:hypothetical protein TSAR_001432 [Trichomalopsis sarcophagae]|uniref:Uncharacterized protein n=1 Tax=Trichomalopsis sarcophagae TaxID=543379 RepID=A0A232FHC0_9HYME|nr:hypothetical protein TSAR_001432 [Trichomalopsis sarcophagae]
MGKNPIRRGLRWQCKAATVSDQSTKSGRAEKSFIRCCGNISDTRRQMSVS